MKESSPPRLGPYRLERPLGQGGMAQVWEATHTRFGFSAAVKVVAGNLLEQSVDVAQIFSEARSHAGLEHPRIIRLLDYGHVEPDDVAPDGVEPGHPYLVMERATGTLRERSPLRSFSELSRVVSEILDALAFAHARGVLHRDLKPENILYVDGPTGPHHKLADFGIAHPVRLDDTYERQQMAVSAGTPAYMPPEQLRGQAHAYGPWTDLYALGCMTFELVCGRPPFGGESVVELAMRHMNAPVPPLEPRFAVPDRLEAWIARLLEKDHRRRFRWAADAAFSLAKLSAGFSVPTQELEEDETDDVASSATEILDFVHEMTTLRDVVEIGTGPTVDAHQVTARLAEKTEETVVPEAIEVEPAPMPNAWQSPRSDRHGAATEGLGLFPLRRPAVVGQEDARRQLWQALLSVRESGNLSTVVLRGEGGAPTTEVCEWLATRASEVAAAPTLRTSHTRAGGPREGLIGLAEDFFSLWSVASERVTGRIEEVLTDHVPPELFRAEVDILSAEVLRARGEEPELRVVPTRHDRYRILSRTVEIATATRPAILLVENAQWGPDALAFANYLIERHSDSPVLIVLAVSTDEVEEDTSVARALEQLEEGALRIGVQRYDADEQSALVAELLPLEKASHTRIVEATVGDRVFAQSLLADLIETEQLEATEGGFRVPDDVEIPESVGALFERRIRRFVRRVPGEVDAVLELAAVLGRAPEPGELEAVCARLGYSIPAGFEGLLEESGLAVSRGPRWWFVHNVCVARLRARARAAGRFRRWNRACAAMLEARFHSGEPDALIRIADHLEAAGDLERSLGPRLAAAREIRQVDAPTARRRVERCREVLAVVQLDEGAEEAIELDCIEAKVCQSEGDYEQAEAIAERARAAAERWDRPHQLAGALRVLARLEVTRGAYEESARLYREAERIAVRLGAMDDAAAAAFGAGYAAYARADYDVAATCYERAIEMYEQAERHEQSASVRSYLSALLLARGDYDAAVDALEHALETARRIGNVNVMAEAVSGLGEIARYRGNYEEALERYRESRYLFTLTGSERQRSIALNIALTRLGQGDFDEARSALSDMTYAPGPRAALVAVGKATCDYAAGRGDAFDEGLDEAVEMVGDALFSDFAWILEIASSLAHDRDDDERIRRIDDLLLRHYERLSDEVRADAVRRRRPSHS